MDLSKFKTSDWLKVGGAVAVLIFGFLRWWGIDLGFASVKFNAFDYFFTGTIPWLLLVAIGVLTFLAAAGIFRLPASFPAPIVYLAASALSLLLIIIRLFGPGHGAPDNSGLSRGIGLWVCLLGAIASVVGSVLAFQESGGNLADLKDMNKLKAQFGNAGGGATPPPPPPPPPGMAPPPPPPPAG